MPATKEALLPSLGDRSAPAGRTTSALARSCGRAVTPQRRRARNARKDTVHMFVGQSARHSEAARITDGERTSPRGSPDGRLRARRTRKSAVFRTGRTASFRRRALAVPRLVSRWLTRDACPRPCQRAQPSSPSEVACAWRDTPTPPIDRPCPWCYSNRAAGDV